MTWRSYYHPYSFCSCYSHIKCIKPAEIPPGFSFRIFSALLALMACHLHGQAFDCFGFWQHVEMTITLSAWFCRLSVVPTLMSAKAFLLKSSRHAQYCDDEVTLAESKDHQPTALEIKIVLCIKTHPHWVVIDRMSWVYDARFGLTVVHIRHLTCIYFEIGEVVAVVGNTQSHISGWYDKQSQLSDTLQLSDTWKY